MSRFIYPEQREWQISKSEMPPVRNKEARCRKCHKKISQFNFTNYCFIHFTNYIKEVDSDILERQRISSIKYRKTKKVRK